MANATRQLVIMAYYNRIHYGRNLTELDSAIQRAMVDLNLQADMVQFMMAINADTRVDTKSITHMVYGMDKKEKVLENCVVRPRSITRLAHG